MILVKPCDDGIRKCMRKAAHPSSGVDSSNPCRRRGKQLHHHGGDDRCVFVLCIAVSSDHLTHRM